MGTEVNDVKLVRELGMVDVREAAAGEAGKYGFPFDGWSDSFADKLEGISLVLDHAFDIVSFSISSSCLNVDVTTVGLGNHCVTCGHELEPTRGIEVGNIFKLGTYCSQPMQATFNENDGSSHPFIMGCYGIGITRMFACIIEDNHDEHGMVWPDSVAPYGYHLVTIGTEEDVVRVAEDIYGRLAVDPKYSMMAEMLQQVSSSPIPIS